MSLSYNQHMEALMDERKYWSQGSGCSAPGCQNSGRRKSNASYFRFPVKDSERCDEWLVRSKAEKLWDLPKEKLGNKRLCNYHFAPDAFMNEKTRDRLRKDAIPTIFNDGDRVKYETSLSKECGKMEDHESMFVASVALNMTEVIPSGNDENSLGFWSEKATQTAIPAKPMTNKYQQTWWSPKSDAVRVKKLQEMVNKHRHSNHYLKKKIARLEEKLKLPPSRRALVEGMNEHLSGMKAVFCRMQVRQGKQPWTEEEKLLSVAIFEQSRMAYKFLRRMGLTLPCISVVKAWEKSRSHQHAEAPEMDVSAKEPPPEDCDEIADYLRVEDCDQVLNFEEVIV